jgi:hypothetical protein
MSLWSWLTGTNAQPDNRNRGSSQQEADRRLSIAMPMAAAGATLGAQPEKSETEKELDRAVDPDHTGPSNG